MLRATAAHGNWMEIRINQATNTEENTIIVRRRNRRNTALHWSRYTFPQNTLRRVLGPFLAQETAFL